MMTPKTEYITVNNQEISKTIFDHAVGIINGFLNTPNTTTVITETNSKYIVEHNDKSVASVPREAFKAAFRQILGVQPFRKEKTALRISLGEVIAEISYMTDRVEIFVKQATNKTGLIVGKFQMITNGQKKLIQKALDNCDDVIIVIGSTQNSKMVSHPFEKAGRISQLQAMFGSKPKYIDMKDINSLDTTSDWIDAILKEIDRRGLKTPTDLFTSSWPEAKWYLSHFNVNKNNKSWGGKDNWLLKSDDGAKQIWIQPKDAFEATAGEVRSLYERRDEEWRDYVPAEIQQLVESLYPENLMVPFAVEDAQDLPKSARPGTAALVGVEGDYTRYEKTTKGWKPIRSSKAVVSPDQIPDAEDARIYLNEEQSSAMTRALIADGKVISKGRLSLE